MSEPYYADESVALYHGDALDLLRGGVIKEVGSIVTDPPYCSGGRSQAAARNTVSKSVTTADGDWLPSDSMGSDSYVWWMRQIGREFMKITPTGAHLYCFTDWRQYGNVVTAFETVGWSLRSCVVWAKNRGGAMGSFWRNDHEWIATFSKGMPAPLPNGSSSTSSL